MSFLSEELERQMARARIPDRSWVRVAETIQVSTSQIYKWVRGEQTHISPEHLDGIAKYLSDDLEDHAQLVVAHLFDEKFGSGSELVHISIKSRGELRDKPRPKSRGERAIHFLAESRIENRDVNEMLIDLARCLGAEL